jgi:hypothetical protein
MPYCPNIKYLESGEKPRFWKLAISPAKRQAVETNKIKIIRYIVLPAPLAAATEVLKAKAPNTIFGRRT